MLTVKIVILNYNGRELLERCLPSIAEAARRSPYPASVTVLDNCSADNSRDYVEEHHPGVSWVDAPANRIFCSYNAVVEASAEDIVILLNNDIRVESDFVAPLLSVFEKHYDAFFAAPKTLNFVSGSYEGGRAKWEFRYGLPWGSATFEGYEKGIDQPGHTMQTGFGAFRRERFVELRGFDDLYLPGTVEDADLCFRAWRRGWRGYYCPDSVVHHMGQATFKKTFGRSGIERMNRRNLYLFTWKNIHDASLWAEHLFWLPVRLAADLLRGRTAHVGAFFDALGRRRTALAKRETGRRPEGLSEKEVFAVSKSL